MGKIHWYPRARHPPDLRVCSAQLIVKPDEARVARNWSIPAYGLNGLLIDQPVEFGDMGGFLRMLPPRRRMAGLDFRDFPSLVGVACA